MCLILHVPLVINSTLWHPSSPHRSRIRRELFIEEIQAAAGEGGARAAEGESSCDGTESDSGGGVGSGSMGGEDRGRSLSNSPKPNHHHHHPQHHSHGHASEDNPSGAPGTSDSSSKPGGMDSLFGGAIATTVAASATATADKNPKDSSVRRRKAANLNNIIHRLEKAANRDELGNEWEF